MSPRFVFRKLILITLFLAVCGVLAIVHAGIRGPGKYSGVVIFDRWDTCLLLSGNYVTYVSDGVKENLRTYTNQAIQVYASEVSQTMNPGDALIRKYTIIGLASRTVHGPAIEGTRIIVKSDFDRDREVAFVIRIENSAGAPIQIESDAIGPTLIGVKTLHSFNPSDGRSMAWITRGSLLSPSAWSSTIDHVTVSATYSIEPNSRLPEQFTLKPGESKQVRVILKVPPGPYQFLVGYGGGVHESRSLASNAISFHIDRNGRPVLDE